DAQLVRMVQVGGSHRMRIEVDTAEVDDPRQLGSVRDDDFFGGAARWERQLDGLDPLWARGWSAFLEKSLALRTIDEPLEGHRSTVDAAQRPLRDGHVIAHQIELRVDRKSTRLNSSH